MPDIVARWQDWDGNGLEHLVLQDRGNGFTAESSVIGEADGERFAVLYTVVCDRDWRTALFEVNVVGSGRSVLFTGDGAGNWQDGARRLPELNGAIDVDITATPFTNTLPIRRLGLAVGEATEIDVVWADPDEAVVQRDPQRYTRLGERTWRFDSLDSDFTAELEVDEDDLVLDYPGLFRRIR